MYFWSIFKTWGLAFTPSSIPSHYDTGLTWIAPSPNFPTPISAWVYPGQVIWEGTNVSEGRGNTQPSEFFGAPFFDTDQVIEALGGNVLSGAILRIIEIEKIEGAWQQAVERFKKLSQTLYLCT